MSGTVKPRGPLGDDPNSTAKQEASRENQGEPRPGIGGTIVEPPSCPKCEDESSQKKKGSHSWERVILAILPIVISIGALAVSFVSCQNTQQSATAAKRSAYAAEKSAIVAQQNADTAKAALNEVARSNELNLRSWVMDVGFDVPCVVPIGTQEVYCSFVIKNFGKIPARNITLTGPNQQFVSKLPPKFIIGDPARLFDQSDQGADVLAIGESRKVPLKVGPVSDDQRKEITSKERFFLILGAVRYSDAFNKDWYTVWCYFYDIDTNTLKTCPGGSLIS